MGDRPNPTVDRLNAMERGEVLQRFAEELGRAASSTLTGRVGRNVAFTPLHPTAMGAGTVPLPALMWRLLFTGGLSGWAAIVFKVSDAHALASLLLGGEGTSEVLTPEGEVALREAAGQVAVSLAQSLGDVCGRSVGCEPPAVVVVKEEGGLRSLPEGAAATAEAMLNELEVEGGGKSQVLILLEPSLLTQLHPPVSPGGSGTPFPLLAADPNPRQPEGIGFLLDVPLLVTVELGRTRMPVREVLHLAPGSVVELDKLAGEPVDILVNDTLIARGEVVVMGESFGIRLSHIVSQAERIQNLRRKSDISPTPRE